MTSASEVFEHGAVLLDGAMATSLFARGLDLKEPSPGWNLSHPEEVLAVHAGFLSAGCEVVQTNTFLWRGVPLDSVVAGAELARRAVSEHGRGFVAGNLGPLEPGGPSAAALGEVERAVRALAEHSVDWISIETLGDLEAACALATTAAKASDLEVTACFTLTPEENCFSVLGGASLTDAAHALEAAGATALGINCSAGSAQVLRALPELLAATSLPVIAKPNAGTPRMIDGQFSWSCEPAAFAAELRAMLELGASAVGGCCGTTHEHLVATRVAMTS